MCVQCFAALHIKKALGIYRELITTASTTRVVFWDPPSGSKNVLLGKLEYLKILNCGCCLGPFESISRPGL